MDEKNRESGNQFYDDFYVELSQKKKKNKKNSKLIFIGVTAAIILVLVIIIILLIVNSNDSSKEDEIEYETIGEINCIYYINSINTETQLISEDYLKINNFGLYIDGMKVKYLKKYSFNKLGEHRIKIALYENLRMEKMFKDITSLISVEMKGQNDTEILSINNAFENCVNLQSFSISNFITSKITSMKKLFYNTGLSSFSSENLDTSNVVDMSYLFAYTKIQTLDLLDFSFENVKDLSYMFYKCSDLNEILNMYLIDTQQVNNLSHMFSGCDNLES
jgi:predicted nucleic acid-binding Zn ribbon protein